MTGVKHLRGGIEHEGRRVFPDGLRSTTWIAEYAVSFAMGGYLMWTQTGWVLGPAALMTTFFLIYATGRTLAASARVTITAGEVRLKTWQGEQVVPRSAVARVVSAPDIRYLRLPSSFLALLDSSGQVLLRVRTWDWAPETLDALAATGREVVTIESSREARRSWGGLVRWAVGFGQLKVFLPILFGVMGSIALWQVLA